MRPSTVTIVMYHYVRDSKDSRYPGIKGVSCAEFEEQVRYLKRHHNPISGFDLMDAVAADAPLPSRPLLLTFDDGYADHFANVLPVLERHGVSGCFFPPARCILEHRVLDVNKIHFILAAVPDTARLVEHVLDFVQANRGAHGLAPPEAYWERLAKPNRFDPAEVIFVKRMLQRELPPKLRGAIVERLFDRYVSGDDG
jgi:hypothetical protein